MKLSFFKKFTARKKRLHIKKRLLYTPIRDWKIMIGLFLTSVFVLMGAHYLLYTLVDQSVLFSQTAEEEKFRAVLKKNQIEETIQVFEDRIRQIDITKEQWEVLEDPAT